MSVIVDADVLVVLVSGDPRRAPAQARLREWMTAGEEIHAPALLRYEVANALTRLAAAGLFPSDRVAEAWQTILSIPITYHPLVMDGPGVVTLALKLLRRSAYDAAYLQLAGELGADLWTFDGPLARNARGLGLPIHLLT